MAGAGKGGPQTTTTTPDQGALGYRQWAYNAAQGAGNPLTPADPRVTGAYGTAANSLGFGVNALQNFTQNGFDPNGAQQFFNPYQQNVIDAAQQQLGIGRQQTMQAVNDQATQAHAFGGDRAAVAQGTALANLQASGNQLISGLQQSGYNQALQNSLASQQAQLGTAGQLASLGLQGTSGLAQYLSQLRGQNLGFTQGNFGAPTGQTQSVQPSTNWLNGLLGIAGTVAGGPLGGMIGGGLGSLFGGGGGTSLAGLGGSSSAAGGPFGWLGSGAY